MLERIDLVKKSPLLTAVQRQVILKDMSNDLPLEMFSTSFKGSRSIVKSILEELQNVGEQSKESASKSTPETKGLSTESAKAKLHDRVGEDGGRQGVKKDVVAKAQKKPRKAKGST
tara:strand:+ start:1589 stop:1936 length:348 start_codon:yes stop_codon:yes gene_type:complete